MADIAIAAVVTVVVSALVWGAVLYVLPGRTTRYLWLVLPALPLSTAVNLAVKRPLGLGVAEVAGIPPEPPGAAPLWYLAFVFLLSPVAEELAKLAPLGLRRVRRVAATAEQALWTGMALGIGFGIGEAVYLAYGVGQDPQFASTPWYAFVGFFNERLAVCFGHGVMTAVAVVGLVQGGRRRWTGPATAVGLHALANVGAFLYQVDLVGQAAAGWAFVAALILLTAVFERLRRSLGRARTPASRVYYERQERSETG